MELNEHIRLTELCNTYGELLSSKQKMVIEDYLLGDMSLAEIADNLGVTRQAILDTVKVAKNKLEKYESIVGMCKMKENIQIALSNNHENLKSVIAQILEEN